MQELEKIIEEMNKIKDGNRKEKIYAKYPPNSKEQEILNAYSQGYEDGTDNFYNAIMGKIRKHMSGKDTDVPTNDGWIPVEERLPEESGYYRVTVKNKELGDITEETAWFAHVDDYDIDESEWRAIYEFEEVIAWRELEPYRPERSGNEVQDK